MSGYPTHQAPREENQRRLVSPKACVPRERRYYSSAGNRNERSDRTRRGVLMEKPEWPTIVYRVFGVTNFLVVMVGGFFMASFIPSVVSGAVGNSAKDPYFLQFYWPMAAMNVCVLGSL